jgi:hypothetical protein
MSSNSPGGQLRFWFQISAQVWKSSAGIGSTTLFSKRTIARSPSISSTNSSVSLSSRM